MNSFSISCQFVDINALIHIIFSLNQEKQPIPTIAYLKNIYMSSLHFSKRSSVSYILNFFIKAQTKSILYQSLAILYKEIQTTFRSCSHWSSEGQMMSGSTYTPKKISILFTSLAIQLDVNYHLAGPIILIFDVSSYSLLHLDEA